MESKPSKESFLAVGQSLVDAFYLEKDRKLSEHKADLRRMAETKEALSALSGIHNEDVLRRLVELNVRPETLAALAVVPLVEIVWADGIVDDEERQVVLERAAAQGIVAGNVEHDLLERWLAHRPEPALFDSWQQYVRGLCEQLTQAERQALKEELLADVLAAAEASGGFLGMGRISTEEKAMLAKLEACFSSPGDEGSAQQF